MLVPSVGAGNNHSWCRICPHTDTPVVCASAGKGTRKLWTFFSYLFSLLFVPSSLLSIFFVLNFPGDFPFHLLSSTNYDSHDQIQTLCLRFGHSTPLHKTLITDYCLYINYFQQLDPRFTRVRTCDHFGIWYLFLVNHNVKLQAPSLVFSWPHLLPSHLVRILRGKTTRPNHTPPRDRTWSSIELWKGSHC